MDLTRFALEKNRIFVAALAIVLIGGIASYTGMPRNEDPGFVVRTALIQTIFPGASPERIETLVTDKLEAAIQEIPELDFVTSSSKVGVSIIYVNISERYSDMRPIWDDLRRKVDNVRSDLPQGVIGPFVNDDFGDVFGSLIAITGDGFEYRELKTIADEVRNELLFIPDVARVEIRGVQEERIFVEYDNARLAEYGLSPLQLRAALEARNIILPGGEFSTRYERVVFEPSGNFESVADIENTIINLPGRPDVVRLSDLVSVRRGYADPPSNQMRFNGEPALTLAISMREGGNIIDLGEAIRKTIADARESYPIGVEFDDLQFQADAVDTKIGDFVGNLVQAIGVVTLVMLVFLGLRTGLIVASLIPSAIVAALLVMSLFDIGLDQMSLAALIIALGLLVDNAIVMSESIMVQMQSGKSAVTSALDAAKELRIPLLTSSLTTAAAFLPFYLAQSKTGEYVAPLFKVVTITLLCSWVLALTLIPTLCVKLLKPPEVTQGQGFQGRWYSRYKALLLALLRHPWMSIAAALILLGVSAYGFRFIDNVFFPPNDRPAFTIDIDMPSGTPFELTNSVAAGIESYLLDAGNELMATPELPGIENVGTFVGQGAPKFLLSYTPEPSDPAFAFMLVNTTNREVIEDRLIPVIDGYIRETFPDAVAKIRPLPLGPPVASPIEIRLSGRDLDRLFRIADDTIAELGKPAYGARQITDDWGPRTKKIVIDIDETRARLAGVSHQDVAIAMQTFMTGFETTQYREGDDLIPVVMRSEVAPDPSLTSPEREIQCAFEPTDPVCGRRPDPGDFAQINVFAQSSGRTVPLAQVATPRIVWQPGVILRRDRLPTVTIQAQLQPGYTAAEVDAAIAPWLDEQQAENWPLGYAWQPGGEVESSADANESITTVMPIGFMIIALLLVAQFNSFRRPLIILLTIPLALVGVVSGLLITGSYFGFMTLLGVFALAGIVINNAIVLIDRIRIEIDANGLAPAAAIVEAAQQRLRPILLTTATTIGGLIPLWLGGGPMWEPMAISIIFGLGFATVLTLGIVPVLYAIFFRVRFAPARG
jgi:multidrug efflux pump subunit AcrB